MKYVFAIVKYFHESNRDICEKAYNNLYYNLTTFSHVLFFDNTQQNIGLTRARNILLDAAIKFDYIIFCDYDLLLSDINQFDPAEMIDECFKRADCGIATPRVHKLTCDCKESCEVGRVEHIQNCMNAYSVKQLKSIGGFDERFHTYCADWDMQLRLKLYHGLNPYQFDGCNIIHLRLSANDKISREIKKRDMETFYKKWEGAKMACPESEIICRSM